jgi:hypothetical protein
MTTFHQIFGDKTCHPEHSEGSGSQDEEILRCAQDDNQDPSHVRSREAYLQMSNLSRRWLTHGLDQHARHFWP